MCEIRANAEQLAFMDLPHPKTERARRVLRGPPMPADLVYLWDWLLELRHGVAPGAMGGAVPFTWSDLDAWSRFTGNTPDRDEVRLLREVEAIALHPPAEMPEWDD